MKKLQTIDILIISFFSFLALGLICVTLVEIFGR